MKMNSRTFHCLFILVTAFAVSTIQAQLQDEQAVYDEYRFARFDEMYSKEGIDHIIRRYMKAKSSKSSSSSSSSSKSSKSSKSTTSPAPTAPTEEPSPSPTGLTDAPVSTASSSSSTKSSKSSRRY